MWSNSLGRSLLGHSHPTQTTGMGGTRAGPWDLLFAQGEPPYSRSGKLVEL